MTRGAADRPLSLQSLPSELLRLIVAYLDTPTQRNVALVSQTLHHHATDALWQKVCLADQWKLHVNEGWEQVWGERGRGESDEHDDTPIVQKLYILATNPTIASKVQVLIHRCHLPTPNIFSALPRMHFDADNLSQDNRIHVLLKLAIRNLVNVHTLRIIYGHWKLTNALLAGFLDGNRPRSVPLRKLWLECCCFEKDALYWLLPSKATGLESIRLRRLGNEMFDPVQRRRLKPKEFKLARGGRRLDMYNGAGGFVQTTVDFCDDGYRLSAIWPRPSAEELIEKGTAFDAVMWEELADIRDYVDANPVDFEPTTFGRNAPDVTPPLEWLIACSASTLTSLNLDWVHWRRSEITPANSEHFLHALSKLRFPHLRALQIRNAVLPLTRLPDSVYLLEDTFVEFLEAHPKIQCLAWPIDKVYSHVKPSVHVQARSQRLVAHLAMVLTDLRIDAQHVPRGEPVTDESRTTEELQERTRRRRFIAEFAPHMRKVEQIKLEGGIPRDEKRELIRALHWCPLKKIVMIGASFPAGNTWGAGGHQLKAVDPGQTGLDISYALDDEDIEGILAAYRRGFPMPLDFTFEPEYGWPPQAPLLQTIALHHASTVEELKICGYNGCPILSHATPITNPLLMGLRSYDNLKQLVLSFWLLTWYDGSYRDPEIIQSWLDTRSPSSTALTVVTPPASPTHDQPVDPGHFPNFGNARVAPRPQDFNRWAVALKTEFSPSALAYRVARDIGPYLSPLAKERKGGVRVRASFCLGVRQERECASDIFDLDIRVGVGDQVLEFVGPREEGESGRWWKKLEERRWF
ncbi:uncharacterized protein SETTUDRAFT_157256 [Exserohilum turcica Et28A]|uniref:F-box domain-containing protein n=1 Tax=Exserohilum turcicum (strain 28A) TaxID=671987 RepID=R0JUX7_EXST2|nr:uncharacterized protein SETTUDRAFT_157256 [Exserohilum turcica Et28A]EOA81309.1 hypothetical protein SETTUDRAFT_157256 [Exserohilum turcica Et28A]